MDNTRKLLLLLESDPKAFSLPLLGMYVCYYVAFFFLFTILLTLSYAQITDKNKLCSLLLYWNLLDCSLDCVL